MDDEIKFCLDNSKEEMRKSLDHLAFELSKIRAGRASANMVDSVKVDYYGSETPLSQVANVSTLDARSIMIQPWERSLIDAITKAIMNAKLGFNPSNDGTVIHISVPPLTEERRRILVKRAKVEGEHAKVSVRNHRKDANDFLKDLQKEGVSEDLIKNAEKEIQHFTDDFSHKIDLALDEKEKDILTV